jgi:uncharacterized protein involved in response to NO
MSFSILFTYAFRIFFLLGGLGAALLVPAWLAMLTGYLPTPDYLGGAAWHGHELIFAYAPAVIVGFLLTAAYNWTGTANAKGLPLVIITLLWLGGRLALLAADSLPGHLVALVDLAFLPAAGLIVLPPLWRAKKWSNTAFVGLLMLMAVANLLIHLDALGVISGTDIDFSQAGLYAGLDIVLLVMVMVGGRITPPFSRNATGIQVAPQPRRDQAAVGTVVLVVIADLLALPGTITGFVCLLAAAATAIRVASWQSLKTTKVPLIWILHLAQAWLVIGFTLRGIALLTDVMPQAIALHALTLGAVGSLTLGMMTRVALGHTGRPLEIKSIIPWTYAAISLAALVRIVVPTVWPEQAMHANTLAGALWTFAFATFVVVYLPVLTSPRPDGRPG